MTSRHIITDVFQAIADKVIAELASETINVWFSYGHYTEVGNKLIEKSNAISPETRKKYPLIWLVLDIDEGPPAYLDEQSILSKLQLLIATLTDQNSDSKKRIETNFKPLLYLVYDSLISNIASSTYFKEGTVAKIMQAHTKTDRPYWGGQTEGDGKANFFTDYIDAIQIRNLKLSLKRKIC